MPKDLYATVGDIAKVKLSGNPGISGCVHNKRDPTFRGCELWQVQDLKLAIDSIRPRTIEARHHLNQVLSQNTVTPRYRTWFGEFYHQYRVDIGIALWWISDPNLFDEVKFTCLRGNGGDTGPIYFGKYIFQR